MEKELYYRHCINRERNEPVAVAEEGYVYSFETSGGNILKLGMAKRFTDRVRLTEISTGFSADTYEMQDITTYKAMVNFIKNNQDYIDVTYNEVQKSKDYIERLNKLVADGKIEDNKGNKYI